MTNRTSRNIFLVLVGTVLLSPFFLCAGCGSEETIETTTFDENGNPVVHRSSRPRYWYFSSYFSPGYGRSTYSGSTITRPSSTTGSTRSSTSVSSGSTSRGGFGSTGGSASASGS